MYYGVIATVDSYMTTVAEDITRLCLGKAYAVSYASHGAGRMGQTHTEVRVYTHNKAGAVCSVGEACAAVYVRITHKLTCIADYGIAAAASGTLPAKARSLELSSRAGKLPL